MQPVLVRHATLITVAGCVPLLLIGCVGAWFVNHVHQLNATLLTRHVTNVIAAEELEIEMREIRNRMNRYLRTDEEDYLQSIPKLRSHTTRLIDQARARAQSPDEVKEVTALQAGYDHFFSRFQELASQLPHPEARQGLSDLIDNLMAREVFVPARRIVELHQKEMVRMTEIESRVASRMGLELMLMGACGAGAGALCGFGLARSLRRLFIELNVSVNGMAGQLAQVVEPISLDSTAWGENLELTLQQIASRLTLVIDRFQASQREVLRAEQLAMVGQLAAGLAHELRNALMPVKLLVESALQDQCRLSTEELGLIASEIDRLELSVTRLLEFARPAVPEKTLFDLRSLVKESLRLIAGRSSTQRVTIDSQLPADAVLIDADKEQLRQVIINLLLNALDAMPEGGQLTVSLPASDDPAAVDSSSERRPIVLMVMDTGAGLPSQLVDRVFEPFVTNKPTGTGLGLSICKRIVEAHGGRILAANRPSHGAAFSIELPACCT